MTIFTVHVPRTVSDRTEQADRTAFVRDGFNVWAFLFGPLFLLRHRAWIALAAWVVLVAAGGLFTVLVGVPTGVGAALLVLLELFLGLEGNNLRRMALERRGFDFADVVAGGRRDTSELAFFQAQAFQSNAMREPEVVAAPRAQAGRRPAAGGIIGLFPDAGS